MNQSIKNRENIIYEEIMNLKNGTDSEKKLAFNCIGILGNESSDEKFENRLNIVEKMIENYFNEVKQIKNQ